jgi:hypothetical protein
MTSKVQTFSTSSFPRSASIDRTVSKPRIMTISDLHKRDEEERITNAAKQAIERGANGGHGLRSESHQELLNTIEKMGVVVEKIRASRKEMSEELKEYDLEDTNSSESFEEKMKVLRLKREQNAECLAQLRSKKAAKRAAADKSLIEDAQRSEAAQESMLKAEQERDVRLKEEKEEDERWAQDDLKIKQALVDEVQKLRREIKDLKNERDNSPINKIILSEILIILNKSINFLKIRIVQLKNNHSSHIKKIAILVTAASFSAIGYYLMLKK